MSDDYRPRRRKREPEYGGPIRQPLRSIDVYRGIVGVVLLLAFAGFCYWWYHTIWTPFTTYIPQYTVAPTGTADPSTIKKMIIVDMREKQIDPMQYLLAAQMRANWPSEVTTVAQVRWRSEIVGRYSNGGIATRAECEVAVIDLATKGVISSRSFQGAAPPHSFVGRRGSSAEGEKPYRDVLTYLEGLHNLKR